MTELQKCPICGGNAYTGVDEPLYTVRCYGDCKVRVYGTTKQKAVERWNAMDKAQAKTVLRGQILTKEELEEYLERKIAEGTITVEEAEDEWQDWMHRTDHLREW